MPRETAAVFRYVILTQTTRQTAPHISLAGLYKSVRRLALRCERHIVQRCSDTRVQDC